MNACDAPNDNEYADGILFIHPKRSGAENEPGNIFIIAIATLHQRMLLIRNH